MLRLICRGTSSADIAGTVGVARSTVRTYVASLYKKLGVQSRAKLVVRVKQHDVLPQQCSL